MSRLFLIRHGQASFLSDNYDQLSETGESQAQALGEELTADNIVFDAVFCGDLVRQVDTAEVVSNVYQDKKLKFPSIKTEVGLNEYPAEEIMTTLGKYLIDSDSNAADLFKKCNDAEGESDRHKYFQKLFELTNVCCTFERVYIGSFQMNSLKNEIYIFKSKNFL